MAWERSSKVKYQNTTFQDQLQRARGYKRKRPSDGSSNREKALRLLKLNTRWGKVLGSFLVVGIFYLLYIPNYLYIKQVKVEGLAEEQNLKAEILVAKYFESRPIWPQKNIALLSNRGLTEFLVKSSADILAVETIKKSFPNSINVKLQPRQAAFLWENSANKPWLMGSDGVVLGEFFSLSSTSSEFMLPKIFVEGGQEVESGKRPLAEELFFDIREVDEFLNAATYAKPEKYILKSTDYPSLEVETVDKFTIRLELDDRLKDSLRQLALLLENLKTRRFELEYIDMKIKDRAFVCFKNTVCAMPLQEDVQASTSTSSINTLK